MSDEKKPSPPPDPMPLTERERKVVDAFVEAMRANPTAISIELAKAMRPEDIAAVAAATSNEAREMLRTQGAIQAMTEIAANLANLSQEAKAANDDGAAASFAAIADSIMTRVEWLKNPVSVIERALGVPVQRAEKLQ